MRSVVGKRQVPIVLDADGLNAYAGRAAELKNREGGSFAITPHPGEMARLWERDTGEVQARRIEVAKKAAADWNASWC